MAKKKTRRYTPTAAELSEVRPPIPDTPENIARACLRAKPKKVWRFEEEAKAAHRKAHP